MVWRKRSRAQVSPLTPPIILHEADYTRRKRQPLSLSQHLYFEEHLPQTKKIHIASPKFGNAYSQLEKYVLSLRTKTASTRRIRPAEKERSIMAVAPEDRTSYVPPPSIGHELGVMFGFISKRKRATHHPSCSSLAQPRPRNPPWMADREIRLMPRF